MRRRDETVIRYYAIYDKNDNFIFVGNRVECIEYINCTKNQFIHSVTKGCLINKKYRIFFIEEVKRERKKCSTCGEVKSIDDFDIRTTKDGRIAHISVCKDCRRISRMRRKNERKTR